MAIRASLCFDHVHGSDKLCIPLHFEDGAQLLVEVGRCGSQVRRRGGSEQVAQIHLCPSDDVTSAQNTATQSELARRLGRAIDVTRPELRPDDYAKTGITVPAPWLAKPARRAPARLDVRVV